MSEETTSCLDGSTHKICVLGGTSASLSHPATEEARREPPCSSSFSTFPAVASMSYLCPRCRVLARLHVSLNLGIGEARSLPLQFNTLAEIFTVPLIRPRRMGRFDLSHRDSILPSVGEF